MTYAQSGVNIDAGDRMVSMIAHHMRRTYGPRVMGTHGAFAGLFRLDYNEKLFKRNYRDPVLISGTDGVGSKVKLACELGVHDTVGRDLVAMSVNDILVQGAEPLFFLDYIGVNKLDPAHMTDIVKGVADGCYDADCALLGGETAEMPDLYHEGEYDLAGFAVGVCELHRIIDGSRITPGDVIVGLASSGLHSNGYSLVRAVVREQQLDLHEIYPELDPDRTLGQVLLTPTILYAKSVTSVLRYYRIKQVITGMAHITGGGLAGNLHRTLPSHVDAVIRRKSWEPPAVFRFLQEQGGIDRKEMEKTFNQGVGLCLIVRPAFADSVTRQLARQGQSVYRLGKITQGTGKVRMHNR